MNTKANSTELQKCIGYLQSLYDSHGWEEAAKFAEFLTTAEKELTEWRELFQAVLTQGLEDIAPDKVKSLWPNSWSQDVAMMAFAMHSAREQAKDHDNLWTAVVRYCRATEAVRNNSAMLLSDPASHAACAAGMKELEDARAAMFMTAITGRDHCQTCDDTGDVVRADGEYLGECPFHAPLPDKITLQGQWQCDGTTEAHRVNDSMFIQTNEDGGVYVSRADAIKFFGFGREGYKNPDA